jgi:hypothetical protein
MAGYWVDVDDGEIEFFNEDEYTQATDLADELADELEEKGWSTDRSWASSTNHYAIKATKKGRKSKFIAVVMEDEEEDDDDWDDE